MVKIRTMSRATWNRLPKLKFRNIGKDFEIEVIIIKRLKSGNLKVGVQWGWTQDNVEYVVKIAQKRDGYYHISESGSPLNSYYHRIR